MKNKRGFTLVELLAVIVILGILLSVTTISVNNIKKKQDRKNFENIVSGILTGAKQYVTDNNILIDDVNVKNFGISVNDDLVSGGYIDEVANDLIIKWDLASSVYWRKCDDSDGIKTNFKIQAKDENGDLVYYSDCGCEGQSYAENSPTLCIEN